MSPSVATMLSRDHRAGRMLLINLTMLLIKHAKLCLCCIHVNILFIVSSKVAILLHPARFRLSMHFNVAMSPLVSLECGKKSRLQVNTAHKDNLFTTPLLTPHSLCLALLDTCCLLISCKLSWNRTRFRCCWVSPRTDKDKLT